MKRLRMFIDEMNDEDQTNQIEKMKKKNLMVI